MLTLDFGQAKELALAFRRCGWTNEEIDNLCVGQTLADVRRVIRGEAKICLVDGVATATPNPSILQLLSTADCSAQEVFKTKDFFKEKDQPDGIKFWLGSNFENHFLKGAGKIELKVPAATLNAYRLKEASVDGPILTLLGGKDSAKTNIAYMAQLIKTQPQGQEGVLLTNGWANIFYVEDDSGELWAVLCIWDSGTGEWNVNAYPVTAPSWWHAGTRIFSPAVLVS